ncbi:MAG: SAM-dependent methyltransferase [Proteobacteria bacterium]|jgi:cyclopropane fatty-acyl-phospholipid synthase-like methyltransferase|nr:SAM-dependent methyltransferase [Pseudomonadota bacterium]
MSTDFWNSRYAEPGYAYGTEPNAFLVSQKKYLKPGGKALAVADGEGRNGVWLAQQGLDVLSVDASEVGLRKTQELAADRGVAIRTEKVDLTTWKWPEQKFDVVAAIFIHFPPEVRARMHRRMFEALKPGGVLILEAFTPEQLTYKSGGPPVAEMLYTADMLRIDFAGGEILFIEEAIAELTEGNYHRGAGAVVRLVLRRPGMD